ncbi:MAG: NADH-quinone oxidoreductase subunit NuoE [Bacteroidales bacterium]|nr:NADH-quinone oxidoreductase subunit NuoE [Bacteroidales bacterium]
MNEIENIVKEMFKKYGKSRTALIPVLQSIIRKKRFLSDEDIVEVAKLFDLSSAEVYGVASFYSFLDIKPRGKYVIRICKTISCEMKGSKEIIESIKKMLKINLNETTKDNKFSLLTTNCLGWCHKGPAMLINEDVYYDLTPEKVAEIIEFYKNK